MSRRWIPRRTEPDTADQPAAEAVEQALITSVTTNRELRAELDVAEGKLAGVTFQLDFHKGELVNAKVKLAERAEHAAALERRVTALAGQLDRERDHTAGSCSHAAELRELKGTLEALEKRVAELQRVNEGYELPGWMPRADSAGLKRLGRR